MNEELLLERIASARVFDRGRAPVAFVRELVAWARTAPDGIFEKNDKLDIYSTLATELGPFNGILHRKAVMLEALRVLAGFESSWKWSEGYDKSNPAEDTLAEMSAGIFQISYDSLCGPTGIRADLKELCDYHGIEHAADFRRVMMSNHKFAIEYTARLLRHTIRHNGPVAHELIDKWVKRENVADFSILLA